MDLASLSPSYDDLFAGDQTDNVQSFHQQTPADQNSEAENFSAVAVPETPLSRARQQPRKPASRSSSVSSVVHIPPGSSLINIQDNCSSPGTSSPSPSPPPSSARRGRGHSGAAHRRLCRSPTPSPTRLTQAPRHRPDNTGCTTRRRSQRHHAPVRNLDSRPSAKISDWTVATLQKTLRDKGIQFHRTDNKTKLFNHLTSARHAHSSADTSSLPDDVITHTPTARRDVNAPIKGPVQLNPPIQQQNTQKQKQGRKTAFRTSNTVLCKFILLMN